MRLFFIPLICLFTLLNGYSQNYDFKDKVSKESIQENTHPLDSSANAAFIFSKAYLDFSFKDGWYYNFKVEKRLKIYNASDAKNVTTVKVPFYKGRNNREKESVSGFKAYVYTNDGGKVKRKKVKKSEVYEEEINEYYSQKVFTFPGIVDGSIVEYTYTISSPHYDNFPTWYFQEAVPVNYSEYIVEIPEYFAYREYTKGFVEVEKEREVLKKSYKIVYTQQKGNAVGGNYDVTSNRQNSGEIELSAQLLKYTATNLGKMVNEDHVYNINNYRSALKHELISYKGPGQTEFTHRNNSWEDVAKTIYKSSKFGKELERTGYYEEAIDPIIASSSSDSEKAVKIFAFVQNQMQWDEKHGILTSGNLKKIYQEKKGNVVDINLMLTAMLRYANLDANPVLLSTRGNGLTISPTINGLNYVVVAVETDQGSILLDASDKFSAPNLLHPKTSNGYGRLVMKNGENKKINMQTQLLSANNINLLIQLDENGEVQGNMRRQLSNHHGMTLRRLALNTKKESYLEYLENQFDGIQIEDHKMTNMEAFHEDLIENIKFSGSGYAETVGEQVYFNPLLFLAQKEQPFSAEERAHPVDFNFPSSERYIINLQIPEGMEVDWIAENVSVSLPNQMGSFQFISKVKDQQILINVTKQINSSILAPSYYLYLKEFYEVMVEKENAQIVLKKV